MPTAVGPPPPLPDGYYFGTGPWFNEAGGPPYPYPRQNAGISAQQVGGGGAADARLNQVRSATSGKRIILHGSGVPVGD